MAGRYALTDAERAQYAHDGYFARAGAFAEGELVELRAAAERTAVAAVAAAEAGVTYVLDGNRFADCRDVTVQFEHGVDTATVRVVEPAHALDERWDALIDDPRLVEPMRDLVGSAAIALWTDKLNLKRPREGSGFRWHQDSPYWIHDSGHVDRLPNVMVLLDHASADNGALRIIPGSHRAGMLPGTDDGSQLGGFFTAPESFDAAAAVPMIASAGSLVFFSPHVVHGSPPNDSDEPRRALIITYQPAGHRMLKLPMTRPVGRVNYDQAIRSTGKGLLTR